MAAQSLAEYAVLTFAIAVAILGIQTYVKRGLQSRMKTVADVALALSPLEVTDPNPATWGEDTQRMGLELADPGTGLDGSDTVSDRSVEQEADVTETRLAGGVVTREGTFASAVSSGRSVFVDTAEVPPDFLLRSAAFEQLGAVGSLDIEGAFGVDDFTFTPAPPSGPPTDESPPPTPEQPIAEPEPPARASAGGSGQ
jgi:hypothetical protein